MEILGIPPGPRVGAAYRYLLDLRLDHGPMTADQAREALLAGPPPTRLMHPRHMTVTSSAGGPTDRRAAGSTPRRG